MTRENAIKKAKMKLTQYWCAFKKDVDLGELTLYDVVNYGIEGDENGSKIS